MRRRSARALGLLAPAILAVVGCSGGGDEGAATADGFVDVRFATTDGADRSVADLLDEGPVVLNFWASWCAPCINEMPEFEEVHQELGDRVTFVGVNVNDRPEDADAMVERTGITYLVARDGDGSYAQSAGAVNLPTTIVIAPDGTIAETKLGAMTGDELRDVLDDVLDDEAP
jgi:thiol-disulfide isomerase/thioredoxin